MTDLTCTVVVGCAVVGFLRTYGKQARRTAEVAALMTLAQVSTREPDERRVPEQSPLHRSVVRLIVDDYQAGSSLYELAERYNVRRNTVKDTLRRAGFDTSAKAHRAALSDKHKD
ncbi:MAG TPA: hypothetical protein VFC82_09820 [Actinomycetaceae bacterium]|nr:hypothetical protein [Actinomycetaceae bacterium]